MQKGEFEVLIEGVIPEIALAGEKGQLVASSFALGPNLVCVGAEGRKERETRIDGLEGIAFPIKSPRSALLAALAYCWQGEALIPT